MGPEHVNLMLPQRTRVQPTHVTRQILVILLSPRLVRVANLRLKITPQIPLTATLIKRALHSVIVPKNAVPAHAIPELVPIHESAVSASVRQRLLPRLALRHLPNKVIHARNGLHRQSNHHLKTKRKITSASMAAKIP